MPCKFYFSGFHCPSVVLRTQISLKVVTTIHFAALLMVRGPAFSTFQCVLVFFLRYALHLHTDATRLRKLNAINDIQITHAHQIQTKQNCKLARLHVNVVEKRVLPCTFMSLSLACLFMDCKSRKFIIN